jgi:hypothetical protein
MRTPFATVILAALALACSGKQPDSDAPKSEKSEKSEKSDAMDPQTPVAPEAEPNPVDGDAATTVDLVAFDTAPKTVERGTVLRYSFKSHASVGYGAEFEIGDPAVLKHLRTDMAYKNPENMKNGMTGGDAATGTFVFEAIAPGTSTLRVIESFRGDPESEPEFTITVK